jgi:uncharacterized lipoprotein YajG
MKSNPLKDSRFNHQAGSEVLPHGHKALPLLALLAGLLLVAGCATGGRATGAYPPPQPLPYDQQ